MSSDLNDYFGNYYYHYYYLIFHNYSDIPLCKIISKLLFPFIA